MRNIYWLNRLNVILIKYSVIVFRSEQDKEPEQEAVSEVVGPGPTEDSGNDGMQNFVSGVCFSFF